MAFTFTWDNTAAQAWATNHWGRGGAPFYPGHVGSTVDDIVVVGTAVPPTGGPAAPLTVADFTCEGNDFDTGPNLVVAKNLTMGTALGAEVPVFAGVASPGCVSNFWAASENLSSETLGDHATFNDTSTNGATVSDYATFNDTSTNGAGGVVGDRATFNDGSENAGLVGDYATFNDTSANDTGTVGDYATFNGTAGQNSICGDYATFNDACENIGASGDYATYNGTSNNANVCNDYATFNDAATNDGQIGDYGTFNGTSEANLGSVMGDYATFNDAALKDAGTVGDWATFNGSSYNNAGICGDFATFNSTGTQNGIFSGAQYYVYAPTVFDPATNFTGAAPIAFKLCGPLASVAAAVTSDGGATPIETLFDLAAAAAIGPFPINIQAIGPFPLDSDGLGPYPVTY